MDVFLSLAVNCHAKAVTKARQADTAIGLNEDVACPDSTAHDTASVVGLYRIVDFIILSNKNN